MHSKFLKRYRTRRDLLAVVHGPAEVNVEGRNHGGDNDNGDGGNDDDNDDGGDRERKLLAGPVTLTVTVVQEATGGPTATLSGNQDDRQSTGLTSLPPSTQTQGTSDTDTNSDSDSVSVQTPIVSPIYVTTMSTTIDTTTSIPASTTRSSPSISGATSADNSGDDAGVKLSPGAIAGIAVGCLVVLVVATIFGLRKRSTKNRMRLRGTWVGSKALKFGNESAGGGSGGLEPTAPEGMRFVRTQTNPISPRSRLNVPQAMTSAYGTGNEYGSGGAGTLPPSSRRFTTSEVVVRTFIPSLPDELSVSTGERLDILHEYDDGWVECMNRSGSIGVVPLQCFDRNASWPGGRNSRRYTSLPSGR